jgi:hypothetical protein
MSATRQQWIHVLVAGRRPLDPLRVDDENEDEVLAVLGYTYTMLVNEFKVPLERIHVLGFERRSKSRSARDDNILDAISSAKSVSRFACASPKSFCALLASFSCGASVSVRWLSHGSTDKKPGSTLWDNPDKCKRGKMFSLQPAADDSERWWIEFPHCGGARDFERCDFDSTVRSRPVSFTGDDSDAAQVDISDNVLLWPVLARTVLDAVESGGIARLVMLVGACTSGGSFFRWLPERSLDAEQRAYAEHSDAPALDARLFAAIRQRKPRDDGEVRALNDTLRALPVYVQTSADFEYMSGTWSWHATAATIRDKHANMTLGQLYAHLHASVPERDFDRDTFGVDARGEWTDALMLSQFYGDESMSSILLSSIFC